MLRTVAHRRDSPQLRALLIKKVERRNVQFEELRHLRRVRCSESLRSSDSVSVWAIEFSNQEFAVAPRISCSACFRSVMSRNKSLIRR